MILTKSLITMSSSENKDIMENLESELFKGTSTKTRVISPERKVKKFAKTNFLEISYIKCFSFSHKGTNG